MTLETSNTTGRTFQGSVGLKTVKKTCKTHGEYDALVLAVDRMTGQERTSLCQKCSDARAQSEAQKRDAEIKENIARNISQSGIPKRFEKSGLGNYLAVCHEAHHVLSAVRLYTSDFKTCLENGTSLVLCGRVGTGKTHMACGIANGILRQGFTVKYTTSYKAINAVKATYRNTDQTEAQVIAEFQRPDLLILDEVGIQFGTDAEKIIMYQIINSRYDDVKPIIIISNLDEEGLLKYIGEPCLDRFSDREGAIIPFTWRSYRSKNKIVGR